MKTLWLGAVAGACATMGVAVTGAQAAPLGLAPTAPVAGDTAKGVVQAHGRHWRRGYRYYGYRPYRPRYYYYGSPYYYRTWDWVPPRRYYYAPRYYYGGYGYGYRPYGYYGYRGPVFSIWF